MSALLQQVKGGGQGQAISKSEVAAAADNILGPLMASYDSLYPAEDEDNKEVDDNCSLMYLNEATLLHNVNLR